MSAFVGAYPQRVIIPPNESYMRDYSPQQYGLVPLSPYYYVNQEYYYEPERMHPAAWPVRRTSYHPYSPTKKNRDDNEHLKPALSYVEIIATVILESPAQRLVLGEIYESILKKYPYFENKGSGWRNSIRHNLSLSECFHKGERSANGKGHFWEVDVLRYEDILNGKARNYRRKSISKPKLESSYRCRKNSGSDTVPLSPTQKKLSLVTLMKFDEEVKIFELASKKISGLGDTTGQSTLKELETC